MVVTGNNAFIIYQYVAYIMAKKSIVLQEDSLRRITKSNAVMALAELVWNALDADATRVDITISDDLLSEFIEIKDNGTGISHNIANSYFPKLGGSWKSQKKVTDNKSRMIHGEKGEGRFKAFSLGRSVIWNTSYLDDNIVKSYSIKQSFDDIKNVFISDTVDDEKSIGTTVRIEDFLENTTKNTGLGSIDSLTEKLTFIFAPFLIAYNDVGIYINNTAIDPKALLEDESFECKIEVEDISAILQIFFWKNVKDSQLYLCKDNAVLCSYTGKLFNKIKSFGQEYSAYLSSDDFNDGIVDIIDVNPKMLDVLESAIGRMNEIFLKQENDKKKRVKDKWIEDNIYPYEIKPIADLSYTETATREVFDIVAIQVQEKIKKFDKSDVDTKKFTFRLLAQALEENPKAIQKILNEVLNLSDKERDMFADLLNKMELSSIIQSAKVVADRLNFIYGLEILLYDHKKTLKETTQLHKILETELWLFDENFVLSASDQNLLKVLESHLKLLGERSDDVDASDINGNYLQRTDLMLSRVIEPKVGYKDFLVVELKRPSQKIDWDVLGQIKKYAKAISDSERFNKKTCTWKFIAVSNKIGDDIQDSIEDNKVLRSANSNGNISIYVYTWSEIIENAKAKLNFINANLQCVASDESARKYLTEKHREFLPLSYLDILGIK